MYLIELDDGSIIKCSDDGTSISMLGGNDKQLLNDLEPAENNFYFS